MGRVWVFFLFFSPLDRFFRPFLASPALAAQDPRDELMGHMELRAPLSRGIQRLENSVNFGQLYRRPHEGPSI